jgi:hypothetical protein
MTEYTDIDQINRLLVEQQQLDSALDILDNWDGTVPACTIAPTAGPAGSTWPSSVGVNMTNPPQSMISGIRTGLIQRYNAINQELRDLGVTGTPPNHGPPTGRKR